MPGRRASLALTTLAAIALTTVGLSAQPPPIDTILDRAAHYIDLFIDQFFNVVAEEHYRQEASATRQVSAGGGRGRGGPTTTTSAVTRLDLKSDFLLVKPAESPDYVPFRDVFEVDGTAVRDREQRLTRLFERGAPGALDQARAITEESARYNIGGVQRTVNNPVFALAFLQPRNQSRFAFAIGKADAGAGRDVWIVEYKERTQPTLIRGIAGRNLPVRGRFWIEAPSGRVVRSEMIVDDSWVSASVTTAFRADDRFPISVPFEMKESYRLDGGSEVSGRATYGRFRKFETSTDFQVK